jgi:hypothetical protein
VAPRRRPRAKKVPLDAFEIRARAQTLKLASPAMSIREVAMAIGEPYILVRNILLDPDLCRGLSQFRWPDNVKADEPFGSRKAASG